MGRGIERRALLLACAGLFLATSSTGRAQESGGGTPAPAAAAAPAAPAAAAAPAAPSSPATWMKKPSKVTVFTAKKIVTMDPAIPTATAVAISDDGRILSVGSLADLKPWLDRYPHDIDRRFEKQVIYPGFVEAHGHPLIGGITQTRPPLTYLPLPSPWGPPFPGVKTVAAAKAKLFEYSAALKDPDETLVSWGWDISGLGQMPDRAFLDSVSTTRPILVWDSSEHNMFINSAAIRKFGITPESLGKTIGAGREADGSSNGQFLGAAASMFLVQHVSKDVIKPEDVERSLLYSSDLAQQNGITTMSDLAFGAIGVEVESELAKKVAASNATSQRTVSVAYSPAFREKYGKDAIAKAAALRELDRDRLVFRGIKFMSDDAYLSNTMMVQNPSYTDWHEGISFYDSAESLEKDMEPWWDAGWHIHVHSNGTIGVKHSMDALRLLQEHKPRFDHRFTIEHHGISGSADARMAKALGAVVSVNPAYFYLRGSIQADALGTDRSSTATRVGTLVREGVTVSLHSDNPVAPPFPLTEAWAAVTRRGLYTGDKLWAPAEAVTPEQAMRMVTIDAAYTLGVEDMVGSIEPGKWADFAVLGDDPLTVPKLGIKNVPVVATVLGGRVIPLSSTKAPRPL
ncbi:MAG: amidohydrolase [Deltaproteobacteria bacterium]